MRACPAAPPLRAGSPQGARYCCRGGVVQCIGWCCAFLLAHPPVRPTSPCGLSGRVGQVSVLLFVGFGCFVCWCCLYGDAAVHCTSSMLQHCLGYGVRGGAVRCCPAALPSLRGGGSSGGSVVLSQWWCGAVGRVVRCASARPPVLLLPTSLCGVLVFVSQVSDLLFVGLGCLVYWCCRDAVCVRCHGSALYGSTFVLRHGTALLCSGRHSGALLCLSHSRWPGFSAPRPPRFRELLSPPARGAGSGRRGGGLVTRYFVRCHCSTSVSALQLSCSATTQ